MTKGDLEQQPLTELFRVMPEEKKNLLNVLGKNKKKNGFL